VHSEAACHSLPGTEALDAHQAMMSVSAFTFLTVPLALGVSASIRVGNLLGAQQAQQVSDGRLGRGSSSEEVFVHSAPWQARLASWICIGIGVGAMLICAAAIVALKVGVREWALGGRERNY
jgi:hypothetical protein